MFVGLFFLLVWFRSSGERTFLIDSDCSSWRIVGEKQRWAGGFGWEYIGDVAMDDNLLVVSSSWITYVLLIEGKTTLTRSCFVVIRFSLDERRSVSIGTNGWSF